MANRGYKVTVATRLNGNDFPSEEFINGVRVVRFNIAENIIKQDVGDVEGFVNFVKKTPKDLLILEFLQSQTSKILLPHLEGMNCKVLVQSHGSQGLYMKPFAWLGDLKHSVANVHNWYRWKSIIIIQFLGILIILMGVSVFLWALQTCAIILKLLSTLLF